MPAERGHGTQPKADSTGAWGKAKRAPESGLPGLPLVAILLGLAFAGQLAAAAPDLPLIVSEDFENGADRWQATDARAWKVIHTDHGGVYSLFQQSKYNPPQRSPANIALLKNVNVGDFVLQADVQSTIKDYPHRDMCLYFGYQDPSHFYYVHLGKSMDRHANQIFIVDGKDREKISTKTSSGTPWDDRWHKIKIVRRTGDGTIEVYFDDMRSPAMTAADKTFTHGQVGLGSFDDTGNFDNVKLWGQRATDARASTTHK